MKTSLKKLTNRELIESAFAYIESNGFHVVNKKFGNCYFLFEGEDDSICHFHIKEIPGFLFAFWNINRLDGFKESVEKGYSLWTDAFNICSKTELIFFTQYERDLDKFKPSRSGFVTGIYRTSWEEEDETKELVTVEEWYAHDLLNILKFMKKHPIKAYVHSGYQLDRIYEEISSLKCLQIFIRDWVYDKKYKFIEKYKLNKQIRACKKLFNNVKDNYYIMVLLRPDNWSPRLDVRTRRKDFHDFEKCIKEEEVFSNFDKKWGNNISFEQFYLDLKDVYTDNEVEEDNQLRLNFINGVTFHYTDEDAYDILYSNCEELLDKESLDKEVE